MRPRQLPWKWLLVGLSLALIGGLALLLPRQLGTPTGLRDRVASVLSAWAGGTVTLTEPLHVRYFPPSLTGGFVLSNATKLPDVSTITAPEFKITLDFPELLLGRVKVDALRLGKPTITLKDMNEEAEPRVSRLLAEVLVAPPVGAVRISRGTIDSASGEPVIRRLEARLNARGRSGALAAIGSFDFNGETVAFSMDSGKITKTDTGKSAPVTLKVTSDPLTVRFSGRVHAAKGLEGEGEMDAELPDARRFLNWVGHPLPQGDSLKKIAGSGKAHWSSSTLTFDDGSFEIDGNEAVGLFSVTVATRPRVEGTLAFETLVLDPYIGASEPGRREEPLFDWVLLKHIDADLRISAGELRGPGIELGRGGFTINAKDGTISSEVGELELCGGQVVGRLGLELSGAHAKASLTGTLADIAVATCLQPFALAMPISGVGTLSFDVSTSGTTQSELVRRLSGEIKVAGKDGVVPIDFSQLAGESELEEDGWTRGNGTAFASLVADCSLSVGHIWCQSFRMQTPERLVSGSGSVDLSQQTLDWDLLIADPVTPLDASQLVMTAPPRVNLQGSLANPLIQRAIQPILGDGPPKTDPENTSAAPR